MNLRKLVAILGASGLLVAGCGGAAAASSTSSGSSPAAQGGGPGGGMDLTALATKLGVSESALQKAMQSVRPSGNRPAQPTEGGQPPSGGQPGNFQSEMAAKLAKALNLSESKVAAALKSVMPAGGPPAGGQNGQAPPQQG